MAGRYEKRAPCRRGRDTILHYNMLKILICIVQQNASYPQMYPQKILLPIFALLMAWPLHNIRGDFRQGEGLFFEVAPCCHHRSHPPYPGSQEDRNPFPAPASGLGRYRPDVAARGRNFFATLPARQGQCATFTQKSPLSARGKIFYKLLKL